MKLKKIIVIIFVSIFLVTGIIVIKNSGTERSLPSSSQVNVPVVQQAYISPTKIADTNRICTTKDIKGIVSFEGAAGHIYGTFTLMNTSNDPCILNGSNTVDSNFATEVKNIMVHQKTPRTTITVLLSPKGKMNSMIQIPNGPQCSSGIIQVPVTYTYSLSDDQKVLLADTANKKEFSINSCKSTNEVTTLELSPFTK